MKKLLILILILAGWAGATWLLEGDSHMVSGGSYIGDAIIAGTNDAYIIQAVSGSTSDSVLKRISGDFAGNTYQKFAMIIGTNNVNMRYQYAGTTDSAMIAKYTNDVQAIIDTVKNHISADNIYLITPPPQYSFSSRFYTVVNYNIATWTKMIVSAMQSIAIKNNVHLSSIYPNLCQYHYYADHEEIVDDGTYAADALHMVAAGYTKVGHLVSSAIVPSAQVVTGLDSLSYAWNTGHCFSNASITGDTISGTLHFAGTGDKYDAFVMAYAPLPSPVKYTIVPAGDTANVTIWMRSSNVSFTRDYGSIPWIKTNVLHCPNGNFMQWRLVAKAAANITDVAVQYAVETPATLISGMKYSQKITIAGMKGISNHPYLVIACLDSMGVFKADSKSTGYDLVLLDSTKTKVVDSRTIYLDTANGKGEIAFPVYYDSTKNKSVYLYWGKLNFVSQNAYSVGGDSCLAFYNMSNSIKTDGNIANQSRYNIPLDTAAGYGGWSDTDLVAFSPHKGVKFNGANRYLYGPIHAIFNVTTMDWSMRNIFKTGAALSNSWVTAGTGAANYAYCTYVSIGMVCRYVGEYSNIVGLLTPNTTYDVWFTYNNASKTVKKWVNGVFQGQFTTASAPAFNSFVYIGWESTYGETYPSNLLYGQCAWYQGEIDSNSIKTQYANIATPGTMITMGSVTAASSGGGHGGGWGFGISNWWRRVFR
jgi:hypothetical protein